MRKVKNKEVIKRLSDRSFHMNRMRNRIAVLAIALTSMLFCTVFSVGIGAVHSLQMQTARQVGGDAHGGFKNVTKEQYEKLKEHPSIKESMACVLAADYVKNIEFTKRHAEFWYYPQNAYSHYFIDIIDGKAPKKADEILLDEFSMELLGVPAKAGEKVTLQLQLRQEDETVVERTFTVSGVIKSDPVMNVGFAIVSKAYLEQYEAELLKAAESETAFSGKIRMDVMFSNSLNIQKKLNKVITDSGYSIDEGDENYISSNANWAYISDGAEGDPMTIGAVAGGLALILLTGYLIIYNIFRISIMRDIQYYGLLKTVGTTGKQVKRIIRRQALKLSALGIPAGLLAGFFIGRAVLPKMMDIISLQSATSEVPVNPLIFIGAAVFSLGTVFISVGRPAKMAAKVSPVEALRYTEGNTLKKKEKHSRKGGRIWRMALSNLGRSKTKTIIIVVSLSLSVILLNSVFTIANSFDMDLYLSSFTNADFLIGNAGYFNFEYTTGDEDAMDEENLTESFIKACEALPGFEKGGRIYGAAGKVGVKKEGITVPSAYEANEAGERGAYYGKTFQPIETLENGDYSTMFYGVDEFVLSEMKVWKGESDLEVMKQKLSTGDYIIYAAPVTDSGVVKKDGVMHEPGDKVVLTYTDKNGGYKEKEVTVLSVIKDDYWNLTNRKSAEFPYYTDSEVFKEMLSEKYLMSYSFDAKDDKERDVEQFLEHYTENTEPLMDYTSKLQYEQQFESLTGVFLLVGTALSLVIGIIGILNFINSILTGIFTRQREFAIMHAVGMTKRQLTSLVVTEGVYYVVFTILFSLTVGILFSTTVVKTLSGGMWFMRYHFTIIPMLIILPVMFVFGILVPWLAFHFKKEGSIS